MRDDVLSDTKTFRDARARTCQVDIPELGGLCRIRRLEPEQFIRLQFEVSAANGEINIELERKIVAVSLIPNDDARLINCMNPRAIDSIATAKRKELVEQIREFNEL